MSEKENSESLLDELRKVLGELKKEEKGEQQIPAPTPPPPPSPTQPLAVQPPPSPSTPPVTTPPPTQAVEPTLATASTPTSPLTVQPTPSPAPAPSPVPEPVPSEELLKIGLLFPAGKFDLRDKFNSNLSDAIKKAAKKTFLPKVVFEQELDLSDITAVDFDDIVKNLLAKKIAAAVLICSEEFETGTLRKKFTTSGIFFQAFTITQLDRKIPYLDFLIELMLFKQK